MILKKIKSDPKAIGFSLWARCKNLAAYILNPAANPNPETGKIDGHKCVYSGTRNVLRDDVSAPVGIAAEMFAISRLSRSADPTDHYVFSFHEGESPTEAEVDELIDLALDHFGLSRCLAVFGMHHDTSNHHVHLYVSRHDPVAGKTVKINNGWDRKARQQVVARIEALQFWKPEARNLYRVHLVSGELLNNRAPFDRNAPAEPARLPQKVADVEHRRGEESVITLAQRVAFGLIQRAQSWADLHEELARRGMFIRQPPGIKGAGQLVIGDQPIKLSSISKNFSLGKLEKRLGAFVPPPQQTLARAQATPPPKPMGLLEKELSAFDRELKRQEKADYRHHRRRYYRDLRAVYDASRQTILSDTPPISLSHYWTTNRPSTPTPALSPAALSIQHAIDLGFRFALELLDAIFGRAPSKSERLFELKLLWALAPRFPSFRQWKAGKTPNCDLPPKLKEEIGYGLIALEGFPDKSRQFALETARDVAAWRRMGDIKPRADQAAPTAPETSEKPTIPRPDEPPVVPTDLRPIYGLGSADYPHHRYDIRDFIDSQLGRGPGGIARSFIAFQSPSLKQIWAIDAKPQGIDGAHDALLLRMEHGRAVAVIEKQLITVAELEQFHNPRRASVHGNAAPVPPVQHTVHKGGRSR